MSDADLERLADAAGIDVHWTSAFGERMTTEPDALRAMLGVLGFAAETDAQVLESLERLTHREAADTPPMVTADQNGPIAIPCSIANGRMRYRLTLESGGSVDGEADCSNGMLDLPAIGEAGYHALEIGEVRITVAVAPPRCYGLDDIALERPSRIWGASVQLYGLRGGGRTGAGDFTALAKFARHASQHHASAIAISPVHAMFAADPHRFSPYAPSSRLFLNGILADPSVVFGQQVTGAAIEALGLGPEFARLDALDLIDWPSVARAKLKLFRDLFEHHLTGTPQADAFATFAAKGGDALRDHARYEALQGFLLPNDPSAGGWRGWPERFRSPESPDVQRFAEEHEREVSFHRFVQFLAASGFDAAQHAARAAGMPVGIIADLAVGTDGGGSQGWTRQGEILVGVSAGAPPDLLNRMGQGWGISAFSPVALRQNGFRAFLEMIRASFAHAGGVRIDHVMGLMRLWLVPDGASPRDGAYVRFPFDDLLRLIRLESHRHRAIVVGEDLGTVPEGFRDRLAASGLLGMSVMYFEQDNGRYLPPDQWSRNAMAMTTTHDLPTVAGWWVGRDLDWRSKLGILGAGVVEADERAARAVEKEHLLNAFRGAGVLDGDEVVDAPRAVDAAVSYVGRTASPLAIVPVEDLLGLEESPNLPGTIDEHPNWRRRLPVDAAALFDTPDPSRRTALIEDARTVSRRAG